MLRRLLSSSPPQSAPWTASRLSPAPTRPPGHVDRRAILRMPLAVQVVDEDEEEVEQPAVPPEQIFAATTNVVTQLLNKLAHAHRAGGFTPDVVNATLQQPVQSLLEHHSATAADGKQLHAIVNAIDEAIEVAMLDATCDLPGFKTQTLRVKAGVVTFGRVLSVAALSANPMMSSEPVGPAGGTSRR